MIILVILIILLFVIGFIGFVFLNSSNKAKPFLDEQGEVIKHSISEKIFVEINGVNQGMFIKGKDKTKSILLFLHGGPAVTEQWLNEKYKSGLEEEFVVCWWEQRGAGISYTDEEITIDKLVNDTIAVTNYLRERFGQEKIYLMAHSWGSVLGIQAVNIHPELYKAYISIGQITHLAEQEIYAYNYLLDYYKQQGNKHMVNKMLKAPYTLENPFSVEWQKISDDVIHKAGCGTARDIKSIITGVFLPSFFAKEYTVKEKINLWKGKWSTSSNKMRDETLYIDFTSIVTKLDLPVYFLHGKYDYTCAYPLVKEYYNNLDACINGFYTFENSAHSPLFEEPKKFMKIMCEDVLNGETKFADKD